MATARIASDVANIDRLLLERNAAWAQIITDKDPAYFPNLATSKQEPKVLWIGCADSRVPETTICNSSLGDIFTHRNIANLATPTDDSAQAVVQYALTLPVDYIIVVGHTHCGGIQAALSIAQGIQPPNIPKDSPVDRWLVPIVQLAKELGGWNVPPTEADFRRLAVENARRQVANLSKLAIVQDAPVHLRAWLFEIEKGRLVDVGV
ncbi:carbonic anhydrase [Roridomyces roridus]|uniref:Carbonic anhydrase n=1 Tax=Roridomyces roridus TaxID=1738132 RepID=A0AAD7FAD6_9AGAR|nr:carbonic anhydrase [Roridomyces roridus]